MLCKNQPGNRNSNSEIEVTLQYTRFSVGHLSITLLLDYNIYICIHGLKRNFYKSVLRMLLGRLGGLRSDCSSNRCKSFSGLALALLRYTSDVAGNIEMHLCLSLKTRTILFTKTRQSFWKTGFYLI